MSVLGCAHVHMPEGHSTFCGFMGHSAISLMSV